MIKLAWLIIFQSCTLILSTDAAARVSAQENPTALMLSCLNERGSSTGSIFYTKSENSDTYDSLNYQWNTRYGDIQPLAIIAVESAEDVTNAILCAKELDIHVVAKSGGHSYEKYSHGDNETLIIDMINLKSINVDHEAQTADVGSGALLSHIYSAVWNEGRFGLAAGTCVGVGAAITLGAGHGALSRRFGVTLDNVLEMEVVDVNGNILVASLDSNPDLFWALRGAGAGNFGIVTRIKYKLFDARDMIFTSLYFEYPLSQFEEVFHAWDTWNAENQNGTENSQFVAWPTHFSVSIMDAGLTSEDIERLKNRFPETQNVTIKSMDFIEVIVDGSWPHVEADELANVKRQDQPKSAFRAKSYYCSKTLNTTELDQLRKVLTRVPDTVNIQFSSYGGAINRIASDATAFVHRNSLYNIQVVIDYTEDLDAWIQDFDTTALAILDNGESYQNYNDATLDNYLERYYGSNLPRLLEIKRNLDPTNFFRFPQSIPVIWD